MDMWGPSARRYICHAPLTVLCRCLEYDPRLRISPDEALRHPYCNGFIQGAESEAHARTGSASMHSLLPSQKGQERERPDALSSLLPSQPPLTPTSSRVCAILHSSSSPRSSSELAHLPLKQKKYSSSSPPSTTGVRKVLSRVQLRLCQYLWDNLLRWVRFPSTRLYCLWFSISNVSWRWSHSQSAWSMRKSIYNTFLLSNS